MRVQKEKEVDADTKMLRIGWKFFEVVHLDPTKPFTTHGLFLASTNTIIRIINLYLCYVMLRVEDANIASITIFIKSASGLSQGLAKMVGPFFFRKHLVYVKTMSARFWGKTPVISEEYINLRRFLRLYKWGITITFLCMCLQTILTGELIFICYIPNFKFAYYVLLLGQYYQVGLDVFYVVAMDDTYLATHGLIWRQYRLLGEAFNKLNEEKDINVKMRNFKDCINHHNFLLEYMQVMQELFKLSLMIQYLISVGSICIEFYNASEGLSTVDYVLFIIYTYSVLVQLCVFCFPADMTADAAFKFSHEIYNFDWYNSPMSIQKFLPLVMSQAQKEIVFSAGGLININKEAFTTIFKTAMSFMTFMKQMSDK